MTAALAKRRRSPHAGGRLDMGHSGSSGDFTVKHGLIAAWIATLSCTAVYLALLEVFDLKTVAMIVFAVASAAVLAYWWPGERYDEADAQIEDGNSCESPGATDQRRPSAALKPTLPVRARNTPEAAP